MSKVLTKTSRNELIARAMNAGRQAGTRAILFQQAVAHALGVNATDMKCLDLLAQSGPVTASELVQLTGLTSGAVTVVIDRLEAAGLIERQSDEKDRRKTRVVPTGKAMSQVAPMYASLGRSMAAMLKGFSDRELAFLGSYSDRVGEIFRSEMEKLERPEKSRKKT
jgi:DNA-binding MarR family transcriptional regulator